MTKTFISGGAGDVFAVLHHIGFPKQKVLHHYVATPASPLVVKLLKFLRPKDAITVIPVLWAPPPGPGYCTESLSEFIAKYPEFNKKYNLADCYDLSVSNIIALSYNSAAIPPKPYTLFANTRWENSTKTRNIIIQASSTRAPNPERDLSSGDRYGINFFLERWDLHGLVINDVPEDFPEFAFDRVTYVTKPEPEELFSHITSAQGYLGCSSFLSVICAAILPPNTILVKGHQDLRENFSWFYYPYCSPSPVYPNLLGIPTWHRPSLPHLFNH